MTLKSAIDHGYSLLTMSANGGAYVLTRVAKRRWAIAELSAADVLWLLDSEECPRLESARFLILARTQKGCLAALDTN